MTGLIDVLREGVRSLAHGTQSQRAFANALLADTHPVHDRFEFISEGQVEYVYGDEGYPAAPVQPAPPLDSTPTEDARFRQTQGFFDNRFTDQESRTRENRFGKDS